jgi:hypothetical protein
MEDIEWSTTDPEELLSNLCELICMAIARYSTWPLIEEERILLRIVGI